MSMKQSSLTEFASTSGGTVVYITVSAAQQASVYHSDPDCQYVGEQHRSVALSKAEDRGLDECTVCSGELEQNSGPKVGPQSDRQQCEATNQDGSRCNNPEMVLGVCRYHLDQANQKDDSSGNSSREDNHHGGRENDDLPIWEQARNELLQSGDDD